MRVSAKWLKANGVDVQRKGVVKSPGRWVVVIPGWEPASKNLKSKPHWSYWYRARKKDDKVIAEHLGAAGVTPAAGKRHVSLLVERPNAAHLPDPQNLEESFLDALTQGGFLLDDNQESVTADRPVIGVNRSLEEKRSTITIEDIGD